MAEIIPENAPNTTFSDHEYIWERVLETPRKRPTLAKILVKWIYIVSKVNKRG